jgi:hypothetical protein
VAVTAGRVAETVVLLLAIALAVVIHKTPALPVEIKLSLLLLAFCAVVLALLHQEGAL